MLITDSISMYLHTELFSQYVGEIKLYHVYLRKEHHPDYLCLIFFSDRLILAVHQLRSACML